MEREILQRCMLFAPLTPQELEKWVLPQGTVRSYAQGAAVIASLERVDWLGVILEGAAHVLQLSPDGERSLMGYLSAGSVLGGDLMCTKTRLSPYFAEAAEPMRLFRLPASLLMEPGTMPEEVRQKVQGQLLTLVAHDNMKKYYRIAILSRRGLRQRLMTYLTMQASRQGTRCFSIPFSREELADFLCVNRTALSHELGLLQKEGILHCKKNQFELILP